MPENTGKYGLARFSPTDPIFKRVRKDASTDAENLEEKRLAFGRERVILAEIIKKIQTLNAAAEKAATPEERQKLDMEIQQYYTIASLKGLSGLYDGLGLIADTNCVAMRERDEETKEKIYYRIPAAEMLYDTCTYLERLCVLIQKQTRMLNDIGMKQEAFWAGKYVKIGKKEDDADEDTDGPRDLDQPAMVGVPESKIHEKKTVTEEQVNQELKG